MNKYGIIALITFLWGTLVLGQELQQAQLASQQVDVDYWQLGKAAAEAEYLAANAAALGFISGAVAGPLGWGISYGVVRGIGGIGVSVPNQQVSELAPQDRINFERGYKEAAKKKRRRMVNIGSAIGTAIFVVAYTLIYSKMGGSFTA